MKSEISLLMEKKGNHFQGSCFESLVANILKTQRYKIHQNVNFTGMEVDIIAHHLDREEILYVECKAKEKVSADELSKFVFNTQHRRADRGYFIRTKELEHQAAGHLMELTKDERYKNLTFFTPEKIINLLFESIYKKINFPSIDKQIISKQILAITYLGDYLIYIININSISLPSHFCLIDLKTGQITTDETVVNKLSENIFELSELKKYSNTVIDIESKIRHSDSIAEVQESESWHDYLPASFKYYIGRQEFIKNIVSFIKKVSNEKTNRRVFYLNSKSGWGKSSTITYLRGKFASDYYKNRYYLFAVDCRSASSNSFAALAFQQAIAKATQAGFITDKKLSSNIQFASSYDILSSDSIKSILSFLKVNNKILIIVFDQFEDIFRKTDFFKHFYRFLLDVRDAQSNLVIGFSWKSEVLIQSENESYHLWQLAREQAESFTLSEFGYSEINGVLNQLEESIGQIRNDLKRNLIEGSQGFPWLIKKFCIHVYNQKQLGANIENIINKGVNFQELFDKDLEGLNSAEIKALNFIAKKAYEGNFFDETEVGETIKEVIISSLRDKRLIIKSGATYNIYWDIFRDYLVTKAMPIIGESYILRSSYSICNTVYNQFKGGKPLSFEELNIKLAGKLKIGSLNNVLVDLKNLGLIYKNESENIFLLSNMKIMPSQEAFKNAVVLKFKMYTPLLELKKLKRNINVDDIILVLKHIFKGYAHKEKTWASYASNLAIWLDSANSDIIIDKSRRLKLNKKASAKLDLLNYIPRTTPAGALSNFKRFLNGTKLNKQAEASLLFFELIVRNSNKLIINPEIDINQEPKLINFLINSASSVQSINTAIQLLKTNNKAKSEIFISSFPEVLESRHTKLSKQVAASTLLAWGKFCLGIGGKIVEDSEKVKVDSLFATISKLSPLSALDALEKVQYLHLNTSQNAIKIRALTKLGFIKKESGNYVLTNEGIKLLGLPFAVRIQQFCIISMRSEATNMIKDYIINKPVESSNTLINLFPEIFQNYSKVSTLNRARNILSWIKYALSNNVNIKSQLTINF